MRFVRNDENIYLLHSHYKTLFFGFLPVFVKLRLETAVI